MAIAQPLMLKELQDSNRVVFHDEFQRWRETHPKAVFISLETKKRGYLHGASCSHLGDTAWQADPHSGRNSLTKKRKVLSDSVETLINWSRHYGVEAVPCAHCVGDGRIASETIDAALLNTEEPVSITKVSARKFPAKLKFAYAFPFQVGFQYHRKDIFKIIGLPAPPTGGNWFTGYTAYGDDWFIFCGVGTGGRTGHDYGNHFNGDRLVWFAKTNTNVDQASIQKLIKPAGNVYIFFREEDRDPFTFAGIGQTVEVFAQTPVKIVWRFSAGDDLRLPTQMPEEVDADEVSTVPEGARRTVQVNVYERDPNARRKCITRWGLKCTVCSFDFGERYGALGEGFIHVHHLKPLGEIGEQYELNPVADLRPVCPNCHAMLHRKRPALSIDELTQLLKG